MLLLATFLERPRRLRSASHSCEQIPADSGRPLGGWARSRTLGRLAAMHAMTACGVRTQWTQQLVGEIVLDDFIVQPLALLGIHYVN